MSVDGYKTSANMIATNDEQTDMFMKTFDSNPRRLPEPLNTLKTGYWKYIGYKDIENIVCDTVIMSRIKLHTY